MLFTLSLRFIWGAQSSIFLVVLLAADKKLAVKWSCSLAAGSASTHSNPAVDSFILALVKRCVRYKWPQSQKGDQCTFVYQFWVCVPKKQKRNKQTNKERSKRTSKQKNELAVQTSKQANKQAILFFFYCSLRNRAKSTSNFFFTKSSDCSHKQRNLSSGLFVRINNAIFGK